MATDGPTATNSPPLPDAVEKKVLGFAENVKNQQYDEATEIIYFGGNGCANEKGIMGFAENDEATEVFEFGFEVGNGCGNEKGIMGFAENVKNQENDEATEVFEIGFEVGNGCGNEKGIMGFAENVKNDETEVIEIGFGVRNECGNEKGFMGFAENQARIGKKVRKGRRKGKGQNKCARTDGIEKGVIIHVEESTSENGCGRKSDGTKIFYSRKDIEALRFVNVEYQKKKWVEMYCGFGPVVSKEYDGLVDSNRQQKQTGVNFDPRKNIKKSFTVPETLGEEHFETLDNEMNMNPSDAASGVIATDLDGCTVVEEEFTEDDDSDAEYSSIQRPAFLVTGAPNFDAGPAQDGLEYLRRVRWETERVQKVTFAKIEESKLNKQTVYMPNIPELAKCPEQLTPLKEWESAFLADFSELRLALSRHEGCSAEISSKLQFLSNILEENCSPQIIENNIAEDLDYSTTYSVDSGQSSIDYPIQISATDENEASLSASSPKAVTKVDVSNLPTLSTILGMDSVARVSMLKKRIKLAETMTSLSKNDCAWLFALCAAVDTPLNADTCAALRDLLRKCASLRAEKSELDDEVVMLNILATISGKYFGQSEN